MQDVREHFFLRAVRVNQCDARTVEVFQGHCPADVDRDHGDLSGLHDRRDLGFRRAEVILAVDGRLNEAVRILFGNELLLRDEAVVQEETKKLSKMKEVIVSGKNATIKV